MDLLKQSLIDKVTVFVANNLIGEIVYEERKNPYKIDCRGAMGDQVEIRGKQTGLPLFLAEVEVFGTPYGTRLHTQIYEY